MHFQNILVTGSAGFIGCHFIRKINERYKNISLISLDKLTYAGNKKNLEGLKYPLQHIFIEGDICDEKLILNLLRQYNVDAVVHFAAESHVDRSIDGPEDFIQTNVVGTFRLLEACKQVWLNEKNGDVNAVDFITFQQMKFMGVLEKKTLLFLNTHLTRQTPHTPRARQHPITWFGLIFTPMDYL